VLSADRIYQEFLPADEYDVNLFAHPGGRNVTSVVLKKAALKDGLVGNALSVQRVNERDVAELAEAAVYALCLEGPIDIDIRRGIDGRPFILEINARVGANLRAAEEVLIEILASWRRNYERTEMVGGGYSLRAQSKRGRPAGDTAGVSIA
jgi:predicted ATP-grasp superfamily ATP-dependent carboligase